MNAGRRAAASTTAPRGQPARSAASTPQAESPKRGSPGGAGNPPSPGSVKRGSPAQDGAARRWANEQAGAGSAPMSRVSSFGEYKKDDTDPDERRLEDERGLFHVIEQLAALEGALWSILDGLKSNATHVSYFCREYWGTSASHAQLSLEKLACNDRLKRQVQQACVLESLSLAVASNLCSGIMQGVSVTIRSRLRNLLYYIHENCLVLLDMVCQRWLAENPNHYVESEKSGHCPENLNLDILVRVKRYRRLRKGEHIMALRQHNEMIANVVRQLCRGAAAKRAPLSSRGMSPGDRSPGARGPGGASKSDVLPAVNDILSARMPLDRLRASTIRSKMLQFMRFKPLLNVDGSDPDCPWPPQDPYTRYGADYFAQDGPVIWFEPLPPMLPDLEQNPKLPPVADPDTYTLVLDLDETLVHYFECDGMGNYGIRPGMQEFLQRMSNLGYEIVIFTAATQDYADWVIDQIDENHLIHHRLYRQHALPWGPIFVKDLSRLGRDLDKLLIVDNVQENFMLQPHNGIFICTWYDDPHDTALFGLSPLLDELIQTRAKVPDILDKYREQIPSWAGFDRYAQEGGGEYNDFDQEEDMAPPQPLPSRNVAAGSQPAPAFSSVSGAYQAPAPAFSGVSGPYQSAMPSPPAGVESGGGFRSEGGQSSPMGVARQAQEASPPSSPPAGGMVGYGIAPGSLPHYQTQSHSGPPSRADWEHATAPMVQQTYLSAEQATNASYTGPPANPLAVGTGPALSSSYPGAYQYLPQRAAVQGGYPQLAQAQQARPQAMQQAMLPQQMQGQVAPQRALIPTAQAVPQRAPVAQLQQVALQQQLQMRQVAPAFSAAGGPYQAAPQQPQAAAMWGRAGPGPQQAQQLYRR